MAAIQILDFLAFHHLFGPWAIIIGELLMDVGKFVVVSIFYKGVNELIKSKLFSRRNLTKGIRIRDE